ncbi:MAG: bacteriophage protein [Pseudomonas sp.]|nr:bacteriophage protein [Pseudomonas sp.]
MIQCKRAYLPAADDDGKRILVDRLWPRNVRKDRLPLDQWLPEVAPSTELRRAFKTGNLNFAKFTAAFRKELAAHPSHWWGLVDIAQAGRLTLVYAARSQLENNAVVLAGWLEEELDRRAEPNSSACYLTDFPDR